MNEWNSFGINYNDSKSLQIWLFLISCTLSYGILHIVQHLILRRALQIVVTCCNYFLDQFSVSFILTKNDAKENIGWTCHCHHIVSKQLLTAFIFKVWNNDNCGISNLDSLIRSSSLQQSTIEGLLRSEGYMQIAQRKYIFHNKPS